MKLHSKFRWSKMTAMLAVSLALVVGLGVAMAYATIQPSFVVATDTGAGNQIHLHWSGNSDDTIYYRVQGSSGSFVQWTGADGIPSGTGSSMDATLTGTAGLPLVNGATYVFEIRNGANSAYIADSNPIAPSDTTPPVVGLAFTPASPDGLNAWYTSVPTYTVSATDSAGITKVEAQVDATNAPIAISGPIGVGSASSMPTLSAGAHKVYYRATDGYGNVSAWQSKPVSIDLANPVTPVISSAVPVKTGGFKVTFGTTDPMPGSGVASYTLSYSTDPSGAGRTSIDDVTSATVDTTTFPLTTGADGQKYYFWVTASDTAGRVSSQSATETAVADTQAPGITIDPQVTESSWTTPSVNATVTIADGTSGIASYAYQIIPVNAVNGETTTVVPVTVSTYTTQTVIHVAIPMGDYKLSVVATDNAGNAVSAPTVSTYLRDSATPVTKIIATDPAVNDGVGATWKTAPKLTLAATDGATGAPLTLHYSWDNGTTSTASINTTVGLTAPSTPDGTHTLYFYTTDGANNTETVSSASYVINVHQPVTTIALDSATPMLNGWYSGVTTASITATTAAGTDYNGPAIKNIFYKYDGASAYTTYTAEFAVLEGSHTLSAYSVDASGFASPVVTKSYKLDVTTPVVGSAFAPQVVYTAFPTLFIPVTETGSGLTGGAFYYTPGASQASDYSFATDQAVVTTGGLSVVLSNPLLPGDNLIGVTANDAAGNASVPVFRVVTYIPSVTVNATAGSHGAISPAGVTNVPVNTTATYTVAADQGYHIASLIVDNTAVSAAAGAKSFPYALSAGTTNHTILATFEADVVVPTSVSVNAAAGSHGVVSPAGVTNVLVNTTATFNVAADSGYHIASLLVDNTAVSAAAGAKTYAVVLPVGTTNHTILATFEADVVVPTSVSVNAAAGSHGVVSPAGVTNVLVNTTATFNVAADSGYHIASLLVDNTAVSAAAGAKTYAVVLPVGTTNHTILATFEADVVVPTTFNITGVAGTNGVLSINGAHTVTQGSNLTVIVSPNTGFHIADVLVDGVSVGAVNSYAFTNISANHTISATFASNVVAPKATTISMKTASTTILRYKYLGLSTVLSGGVPAGTTVRFEVKKPGSSQYVLIATRSLTAAGAGSYRYKVSARGTYYFRVRFLGTTAFKASTSVARKVVCK